MTKSTRLRRIDRLVQLGEVTNNHVVGRTPCVDLIIVKINPLRISGVARRSSYIQYRNISGIIKSSSHTCSSAHDCDAPQLYSNRIQQPPCSAYGIAYSFTCIEGKDHVVNTPVQYIMTLLQQNSVDELQPPPCCKTGFKNIDISSSLPEHNRIPRNLYLNTNILLPADLS